MNRSSGRSGLQSYSGHLYHERRMHAERQASDPLSKLVVARKTFRPSRQVNEFARRVFVLEYSVSFANFSAMRNPDCEHPHVIQRMGGINTCVAGRSEGRPFLTGFEKGTHLMTSRAAEPNPKLSSRSSRPVLKFALTKAWLAFW